MPGGAVGSPLAHHMKLRTSTLILFLAPALLLCVVIFVYPLLQTVHLSFYKVDSFTAPPLQFRGLDNYIELIFTPLFQQATTNMLLIWLVGGLGVFAAAFVFTMALTSGVKFKAVFRAIIYFPNIINAVAMVAMWTQYIYNPRYGLFKTIFDFLHLPKLAEIQWTDPHTIFWGMLLAYSWGSIGWFTLLLLAGAERIPVHLYEAAKLDGAGTRHMFIHITLPLLQDVLRIAITMWSITVFSLFVFPKLFSPVVQDAATSTPATYLYGLAFGGNINATTLDIGKAAAAALLILLMVLLVSGLISRLIGRQQMEY
jgi:ABC-type sugar transport system permease subunit